MRLGKLATIGCFVVVLMANVVSPVMAQTGSYCTPAGSSNPTVNTALGCIPVNFAGFVGWLLPKMFGIAGGIAFLLMVYGFVLMTMSGGDPKKVAGAQETVTSAITGLLMSIFALFLLRLIGQGILKIPGL
jgi:hypothetical protein